MGTMFRPRQNKSVLNNLSGIASIISAAIICIRLAYYGILSVEWAAIIMVTVVIMAAIGNVATKLGICAIAIYLFAKYISNGNQAQFQGVLCAILALLIALIGLYLMIKGVFGNNRK